MEPILTAVEPVLSPNNVKSVTRKTEIHIYVPIYTSNALFTMFPCHIYSCYTNVWLITIKLLKCYLTLYDCVARGLRFISLSDIWIFVSHSTRGQVLVLSMTNCLACIGALHWARSWTKVVFLERARLSHTDSFVYVYASVRNLNMIKCTMSKRHKEAKHLMFNQSNT